MSRKPFKRELSSDWFTRNAYYRRYMMREFSCVLIAIYVINLMAGVAALATSPAHWLLWVGSQLNPVMIIIALISLGAGIWHTVTWFQTMPKVIKIQQGDHFMPAKTVVTGCYILLAAVSLLLLFLVSSFA